MEIVPVALVQLLKGVTRGLGCLALPASTSLARPCGPQSFSDPRISNSVPTIWAGRKKRKKKKEIK